jgi:arginine deiminase
MLPVPEDEYELMACNVLAIGPRHVVMLDGLAKTKALLEQAGCRVQTYAGAEISFPGEGGATCLTLPLARQSSP